MSAEDLTLEEIQRLAPGSTPVSTRERFQAEVADAVTEFGAAEPMLALPCRSCDAPAGTPCTTVVDGVDTRWTHDSRAYETWGFKHPEASPEPVAPTMLGGCG